MNLKQFFTEHPKAAIAFSGGVDSAYLLYAGKTWGQQVKAYYVRSAFQPQFEYEDACALARQLGVRLTVLEMDILAQEAVIANGADRCYHCKKRIFAAISKAAAADGYGLLLDGTNASDDVNDRPGMRALAELSVRSPLRECGLTKDQIRELSRQAGLFTHDKPAYACLATRIPTGEPITAGKLHKIEAAEDYLRGLGFRDFRVRSQGDMAKLQVRAADISKVVIHREAILERLKRDCSAVVLDLEVRK